jgi:hypothetical protein
MPVGVVTASGEYFVTDHILPARVQGSLIAALTLNGAGSHDRGI